MYIIKEVNIKISCLLEERKKKERKERKSEQKAEAFWI